MNASFLEWTQLPADLRARVERLMPMRVVIRHYPDGTIKALSEESWNMNWSNERALIFWSGKGYSIFGEQLLDSIADTQEHCSPTDIMVDPCAEDSPIRMDWMRWLNAQTKYDKRNAPFCLNQKGVFA